jgi:5S rRNA maturation endonuclease (ribonuclease M5)
MCLHALGYNAIAPQSETTYMAEDIVKDITSRFNHIYILFDLDDAGRKGAYMLNTYLDSKIVFIPYVDYKDITDYYKVMGKTKTLKLLNKIIVW